MKFQAIKFQLLLLAIMAIPAMSQAQKGVIKGRVFDAISNEPIPFANVIVEGNSIGVSSDLDGLYRLEIEPGLYNLTCTFIGYKTLINYEVQVSTARIAIVDFALELDVSDIDAVEVKASPFNKTEESPVSLRSISAAEIYRNPGGNRDISKVVSSLPGVATSASFRNDIIVRGGAPNENRFFLDGIEIPNINHFATQGSSGGPVGMLNVMLIKNVDFYTGAFPANRGNSLSSVMELKSVTGNDEKLAASFMVGSSDIGLTLDGPISDKATYIFSLRRSYLQFIFRALSLPFLPTYNDFQFKSDIEIDDKNRLTILGLGAIDDFELNLEANDNVTDQEVIDRNNYILGNIPVNSQWNYALGAKWLHFRESSFSTLVVSRNQLQNKAEKYQGNEQKEENLLYDYNSGEIETKVRFENTLRQGTWKFNFGAGAQYVEYTSDIFQVRELLGTIDTIDFNSKLDFLKFSVFGQASKRFMNDRLTLSMGLRTDINTYSADMSNPLEQLSPRLSASYSLNDKFSINANTGVFFQLPAYTVLGYQNASGELANKDNGVTFINNKQLVLGLEYNPNDYSKITVEGFYKKYDNYPFLLNDSVSLANLGADFGVIGNAPVTSSSSGRSYGIELLAQQKLSSSVYGILSYTYVLSEFENALGEFIPSSWDNRHVLNLTAGKRFKRNWEVGVKFRYLGGSPYTPIDREVSSLISVWDVTQQGLPDWSRLNSQRLNDSHGLDFRVDKKWFLDKWSINVYLDVQNAYNFQVESPSFLDVERDENGMPLVDPNNANAYLTKEVSNTSGTLLPSVGILLEF